MTIAMFQKLILQDRAILLVEDEYFQARDMAQGLAEAGARLFGPHPNVSAALRDLEDGSVIDAAVLDVGLRGQEVFPLVGVLADRGIPFLFATGYDHRMLPQEYRSVVVLEKPFQLGQLVAAVVSICKQPHIAR